MAETKKNNLMASRWTAYRLPFTVLFILLVLGGSAAVGIAGFAKQYDSRILPNTMVGDVLVGDLSYDQARTALVDATNAVVDTGITLIYDDTAIAVDTVHGDEANPELATTYVNYAVDQTLDQIAAVQRVMSEPQRAYYALTGTTYAPVVEVEESALRAAIAEALAPHESPARNADIGDDNGTLVVIPATDGQAFDHDAIVSGVIEQLTTLAAPEVVIALQADQPTIADDDARQLISRGEAVVTNAPYSITFDEQTWDISPDQARTWVTLLYANDSPQVGFDEELLGQYVSAIANEIDVPVQEAKFQMTGGRVTEFQPSQEGRQVDVSASVAAINSAIAAEESQPISLVVETVQPELTTDSVNDLGIKELIGVGTSDFSGSPANRRHNIAVGAASLDGLIIAPGEEFSLIDALGDIDGENGYKQELVIKGNKTIPEYGGGLCQIGTTTFRAVLDTGLKVTERRNHSYRVSYYEPAGTDATIYDPAPDFKFVNDTGHHVLLTTEIDGNILNFYFYGTDDGRTVEMTQPRIYNFVPPGPTKLIETTDLPPGVKKCTESAHTGADAEFTRTITYGDGEVYEETFTSHYKPWQEVCLIGVEEVAEEPAEETS